MEGIALVAIGLVAGLVGGMLGVGGSIVMIPAMTELLGPDQHLYQAAAMIVNFFVVVPAVYQHYRAKAISRRMVQRLVPPAIAAVIVGVALSELALFSGEGEAYLRATFGLFLLAVAGHDLFQTLRPDRRDKSNRAETALPAQPAGNNGWTRAAMVAIPTGLVAGLLGVGGGVLAVPLQRKLFGTPIRTAIANSAAMIVATSLIGATVKNWAYLADHGGALESFRLAVILIPTAIIGSTLGSKLTHRLPLRTVKVAFWILLMVAAVRLMGGALRANQPAVNAVGGLRSAAIAPSPWATGRA